MWYLFFSSLAMDINGCCKDGKFFGKMVISRFRDVDSISSSALVLAKERMLDPRRASR